MTTITSATEPWALGYSADNCTIGRAMEILGERWTVVVLREVFLRIRRFDDIQRHSGIPRQVLTNRLARLVNEGILEKVPYRAPGERTRHEYRLTAKGLELQPILVAIAQWGDRHLAGPEGTPNEIVHRDCGALVDVELRCADGHPISDPRHVTNRPGPGAHRLADVSG